MVRSRSKLGVEEIAGQRADYLMARRHNQQTRRRRGIPSNGAGADYHYRNESDWLWMQELAWDMYRNDMVMGSITDRVMEYTVQDGFAYDPDTGDRKLDQDLKEWFCDWSQDPDQCDLSGELCFAEQEQTAFLHTIVAGDIFTLPISDPGDSLADGTVFFRESQFCRSATWGRDKTIVNGIQKNPTTRRRTNYFFTDSPISPSQSIKLSQLTATPAYYLDDITQRDEPNVFHVRFSKRLMTRGVTAYAPLFTPCNYNDDIQFLELVRKRNAALFVFLEQREANFNPKYLSAELQLGRDVTADKALSEVEDLNRQINEVSPGSILRSLPGSRLELNSTNIPSSEHFMHTELLLTILGINLGFPLVMVLMDAKQGSYSSIRGAVNMARNGFLRNQTRFKRKFHRPYIRFKILKRAERDPIFKKVVERSLNPRTKINVFKHNWNAPKWESIDPTKDSAARHLRSATMQRSLRNLAHDDGDEWNEIVRDTRQDRALAIIPAVKLAQKINKQFNLDNTPGAITWRDLAPLPVADGISIQIRDNQDQQDPEQTKPQPKQQPQQPTKQPQRNGK